MLYLISHLNIITGFELKAFLLRETFPQFDEKLKKELYVAGVLKLFKKDEILHSMGQPMSSVTVILSGSIKVYRESKKIKGKEFVITFLSRGRSYGVSINEESDLQAKSSLLTFKATEPTYVLFISFNEKDRLAKKFDQWYRYILNTAVQFYGYYVELIDNIAFMDLDQRLRFFLLRLIDHTHKNVIRITHHEIADSLNTSRESVSRHLKKLELLKILKLGHNSIEIISDL